MSELLAQIEEELRWAGSDSRASLLAALPLRELSPAIVRNLLREEWPGVDAAGPNSKAIYDAFEYATFTTDDPAGAALIEYPCTVYRAHFADTSPLDGISWTFSLEVAERFVEDFSSPRFAMFTGRTGAVVVTRATCTRALGYFNARKEREIIPAWDELSDVAQVTGRGGA